MIVAETSIDTKALAGAASLSTTAITAGAEYALTGRTTLNLAALNFKYQVDGRESTSSTGLLELRLGGAGSSLHLGTGGYRADVGTIAKTIGSRSDVLGVTRAKLAGEGSHKLVNGFYSRLVRNVTKFFRIAMESSLTTR